MIPAAHRRSGSLPGAGLSLLDAQLERYATYYLFGARLVELEQQVKQSRANGLQLLKMDRR